MYTPCISYVRTLSTFQFPDFSLLQIWVENPGPGSLSVSIYGPQPHTIAETCVLYTGDNLYDVTYGVTQPGLYRIFVKWADRNITKEPYICDVSM